MKAIEFERNSAIELITKMINKMVNIKKDKDGYFFYGGSNLTPEMYNNIEDTRNYQIIVDNIPNLKNIFKNNTNWHNKINSIKVVENILKFCFCKLENKCCIKPVITILPKYKIKCRKFYIPSCIDVNEHIANKYTLSFD